MSGLLQKDICILKQRGRGIALILVIGVIMALSSEGTFVIGYLTMLSAILTISTVSYDEFDNGFAFLLTLPFTKKQYVIEKYLFCLLGCILGCAVSAVICAVGMIAKGKVFSFNIIEEAVIFIPIFAIMLSVMLPVQLKYGAEKSRLIVGGFLGAAFVIGYMVKNLIPKNMQFIKCLSEISETTVTIIIVVISIVAIIISYICSMHIMKKKEF